MLFLSDVANPFWSRVVVFICPPSDCRNFLWLVAALLPGLSLSLDSGLSSPGLICCLAMSLRCADLLCLWLWGQGFCCLLACPSLSSCLVMQFPVGSLLPYGSQPSRWGLPYGVETGLFSIGTKVWYVFSFPFGLFLCVVTALLVIVTMWVRCVGRFTLMCGLRLSLSDASLSDFPVGLRLGVFGCPWLSPVPCFGYMSASMTLAPGQPDPEVSSDRLVWRWPSLPCLRCAWWSFSPDWLLNFSLTRT